MIMCKTFCSKQLISLSLPPLSCLYIMFSGIYKLLLFKFCRLKDGGPSFFQKQLHYCIKMEAPSLWFRYMSCCLSCFVVYMAKIFLQVQHYASISKLCKEPGTTSYYKAGWLPTNVARLKMSLDHMGMTKHIYIIQLLWLESTSGMTLFCM